MRTEFIATGFSGNIGSKFTGDFICDSSRLGWLGGGFFILDGFVQKLGIWYFFGVRAAS